jgi:hypothetical protein
LEIRNGADYAQNYDIITKWVGEALVGQTLSVIGVQSGRIEAAFGLEPIDIKVQAGRLDLMLRDEHNVCYHIEEQRDFRRNHLYRFAAYHFWAAQRQGNALVDIILASGDVYAGERCLKTKSGVYTPIVVDFSDRDGEQRLEQIRQAVKDNTFDGWLELAFLPLYGRYKKERRAELVEQVIRFEAELFHQDRIAKRLIAATLIMANKLIDKARLKQLWEVINMLDIIEIAREKGVEEGKILGVQEGKIIGIQEGKNIGIQEGKNIGIQEGKNIGIQEGKNIGIQEGKNIGIQEIILDALIDKFGVVPLRVSERIHTIFNTDVLKSLFRYMARCEDIKQFEAALNLACPADETAEGHA